MMSRAGGAAGSTDLQYEASATATGRPIDADWACLLFWALDEHCDGDSDVIRRAAWDWRGKRHQFGGSYW
jgi:hypothetical protein